ncbi:MAG: YihA family ribosome biogenesis GTP-binding protein, partial [Deltaproteobacteria bacterium]|nr:YihA family ribosome biogenesis GTP-binding protein [Deltaproteobacteria bacterium]
MDVEFIKSAFQEKHYPPPDRPEIAFAGKSNVGKSSLLNTLVNRRKLARTSSTPGRTQAINFFRFGKTLYLVDLPGYGFARVPIKVKKSWGLMVEDYLRTRETLKAVVVILDIRRDPSTGDEDLINWLNYYAI